mmetsp:Transcript_66195/g.173568  ORF Transcript_66195/g.173568 Transcript_66195/m.173568 type:complete len:153 (+) Transcript_66195:89-547(+)
MPCYKIPKANVPAPCTVDECINYKHKVKTELKNTYKDMNKRCESLPDLSRVNNSYFNYFKDPRFPVSEEHRFTYDQLKDTTPFNPKNARDTCHNEHTDEQRRRCSKHVRTQWMCKSSQAYGWLPPLDDPKVGFGKANSKWFEKGGLVVGQPL